MLSVRPCYSATARKLAVVALSEGPIGLAGQTNVEWPVKPAMARSDRHQLGLTEYDSVGSISATPSNTIPASKGLVRPPISRRSDRPCALVRPSAWGRLDRPGHAGQTATMWSV
ncbi:hypothetical protein [Oryza sativa Japonica Group]|uniref:Uncharacterized protein P0025D05.22 n=1 Tax=Oryza sativa subsp. japonica TaxID=39947 RepID=Q5NBK3_ORYSJ|nr:hypothetical protein [Oryza sativa Japonica Group]